MRYKVSLRERFFAWLMRRIAFITGSTFDEPGPHVCFRCRLYEPKDGICRIAVFRPNGPVDPVTRKREAEFRRVFPFDPCVRQYDAETGNLEVFDLDEMRREAEMGRRLKKEEEELALLRSVGKEKAKEDRDQEEGEACTDVPTATTRRTTRRT